jgi:uncharacterized protein (TIGR03067 family)
MRRLSVLLAALVFLLLGSDSPKQYDDATDFNELQGTWALVEHLNDHQPSLTPAENEFYVANFRDHRWLRDNRSGSLLYRTDPSQRPAHLDTLFATGDGQRGTMRYISRRDGNTLQIAHTNNRSVRPLSFDEPGIFVYTYKRVK